MALSTEQVPPGKRDQNLPLAWMPFLPHAVIGRFE